MTNFTVLNVILNSFVLWMRIFYTHHSTPPYGVSVITMANDICMP